MMPAAPDLAAIDPRTRPLMDGPPRELLLRKGVEEEVYTGSADGHVVGLSHKIAADLPGFATEPDSRNVEYVTEPYREYEHLVDQLMAKRCLLRRYLAELDSYTLVPGGTIPLDDADGFQISNHDNPYYRYIRDTYGTRVVTASTHINVGIEDPEELIRAYRVIRAEAASFLALTAASPFLRGEVTGNHSSRWRMFPATPADVPFFECHGYFIAWMQDKLRTHEMQNPRHLWLSVRPNGPATPHQLSRLELRICDRISRPMALTGVVALLEARIWSVLENPDIDPLKLHSDAELRRLTRENEEAAAHTSLDASFHDWRTGRTEPMRDWLHRRIDELQPIADDHGFASHLAHARTLVETGNLAQRWLGWHREGATPQQVIERAIAELAEIDRAYDCTCPAPI